MNANPAWLARYAAARTIARLAGLEALKYFDTPLTVETKSDRSPVTVADRDAETVIRREIARLFPDDAILGEEYGERAGTTGFRWIIDPIDGTRSFIRNIPIWATLVSVDYLGEPIIGIAEMPCFAQSWHAMKGNGAFRDDRPIRVSDCPSLSKALTSYSSIAWFARAGKEAEFRKLLAESERSRSYSDFYGFVLVAQGSAEIMVEHGVHIWDVAGLKVIVEEAGGVYTDWDGTGSVERPDCVASNGRFHSEILQILAGR